MAHHVFGIRHHGPGSARSLGQALEALQPDCVLVEGPPDADALIPFAGAEGLRPPVAILVYPPGEAKRGVFYPFAEFSPEWQALLHARRRGVAVRFFDLPQSIQLALDEPRERRSSDPIALLSQAAGVGDPELWWEEQIERRRDGEGVFAAVLEAMSAVRAELGESSRRELLREAHMRREIRAAARDGFGRVAVVCGAWHAPALAALPAAREDDALLRGLPRVKVEATWIPWTHSRLAYSSGYGAGIESPGFYAHLFAAPDHAEVRWAAEAARLLRAEDLDASAANVIETVRLADALAALRGRPHAGLGELSDATLSVLCAGNVSKDALIRQRLEVGEALGEVPADAPAVPLARDLEAKRKTLRLKVSPEPRRLELDLREASDREKSRLLHRLRLLELDWGEPQEVGARLGTFHEHWILRWDPELALRVVEASVWGQTVEAAAEACTNSRADGATALDALARLLDGAILAELPGAVGHVLARVQEQGALHAGAAQLMLAVLPLARAARYGDVRGTPAALLLPVIDNFVERVTVGLGPAVASLDDDAAEELVRALDALDEALRLLEPGPLRAAWLEAQAPLAARDEAHGLVRGRLARGLADAGALDAAGLARLLRLALAGAPPQAASFAEGLLRGGALALLHNDEVLGTLDGWLAQLPPETFDHTLPLVRRAFARFEPAERRTLAERLKQERTARPHAAPSLEPLDAARAARVLPVLQQIFGDGDE